MNNITKTNAFKHAATSATLLLIAYAITWRFYVMWWFILAFVDLTIIIFYLVVTANSLACWIRNQKNYKYPYLPLVINISAILLLIVSPSIHRNKSYPSYKGSLCKWVKSDCGCNLHFEMYTIFKGGAYETDMQAVYITDLKNFRKYIGISSEGAEEIDVKCNGDNITVTKTSSEGVNTYWTSPKIIEKSKFSLKELKRKQVFE
ncbi:MAG: hypothetical protein JWR02_2956 [Mucilaginibacter sp.]|nr:hypothetical protein [Mucilaginibacter sp.]